MTPPSALPAPVLATLLAFGLAVLGLGAGAAARRLLGRLRRGARVPPPWCEGGVALAWAATGGAAGAGVLRTAWVPVLLGLGWLAVTAGTVDVRHRRLPDALTLPALPVALALLAPLGATTVLRGLLGAVVAVVAHAAVHLAAPAAMGAGDVKLAGPLGAVLAAASWETLLVGCGLAALCTGVVGGATVGHEVLRRRCGGGWPLPSRSVRSRSVPHGLSMLVAGWLVAGAAACGPRGP